MKVDCLIVGQGLAGSAMAMALLARGASVLVIDRESPNSATRVAAGLVTTTAGKGMNPAWRQELYLPEAMEYYRALEAQSGQRLFHDVEVLRLFDDDKQARKFERKRDQIDAWVTDAKVKDLAHWQAPDGGYVMQHGGWLDTNAYMQVVQDTLGDSYLCEEFDQTLLNLENGKVQYKEIEATCIILCQGAAGLTDDASLFANIDHRSAKGEMLQVSIPNKPQDKIINRNGWLVPVGNEVYKVGATYEWSDMQGLTTEVGRQEVEKKLQGILGSQAYKVLHHTAGVRPIIRKSQPLVGSHPEFQQLKFFNGLGSKGVITAPSVARHFAEHLLDGVALDPELDLSFVLK